MQLVPLKVLTPGLTKELVLDLVKNTNINDPQNKKRRGQIVVELAFVPFKSESSKLNGNEYGRSESGISRSSDSSESLGGAGLLSVLIQGAEDVEGQHHNNPYALLCFRGEEKKTKVNFPFDNYQLLFIINNSFRDVNIGMCHKFTIHSLPVFLTHGANSFSWQMVKRSRDPLWNEDFQFMLDEPPLQDKIYIEVMSKSRAIFRAKVWLSLFPSLYMRRSSSHALHCSDSTHLLMCRNRWGT